MRLFVVSVRLNDGLLAGDTLHQFVPARSWTEFEDKINLDLWWDEDDLIAAGRDSGLENRSDQFANGQMQFSQTVRRGDWFPIKNGGEARVIVCESNKTFRAQLKKMGLLFEQGKRGNSATF